MILLELHDGEGMWYTWKWNAYRDLVGKLTSRDHYEDVHVEGRIILK
jgi:hypothetical protein